jgi:prephenate dehydrogenase
MPALAEKIRPHLREGSVVTDAGSVKGFVVDTVGRTLGSRFVGAHPMAGSEQTGIEAARADLFEGAPCILTPEDSTDPAALSATRSLWEQIGCQTIEMSAGEHDKSIARVSHLPHSVAAILVNAIDKHAPGSVKLAGGGYRDTTRVAAGAAAMWREILMENRTEVLAALAELRETCEEMESYLKKEDHAALEGFLAKAQEIRSAVR